MGLGDFLGGILGTQNNFHADPRTNDYKVQQGGYASAAQQAILNAQKNQQDQGDYINMLRGQAAGTGAPSVAQMLLEQQTQRNAQGAASSIASQRGMNPALAAKLALDQAAGQNQQSAGQAAILRSQEQLQAQGLLGQALGQQGSQNNVLLNTTGGLDANLQGLGAQVSGQNAQLALAADQINAGVAGQNAGTAGALVGGLIAGTGAAGPMGSIKTPGGASTGNANATLSQGQESGTGAYTAYGNVGVPSSSAGGGMMGDASATFGLGEGADAAALALSRGGKVPGRASVPGDSLKNDKVPTDLSPGEIVVPRSASTDPDRAAAFVRAVIRKQSASKGPQGYGAILALQKQHGDRLRALEARR